MNANTNPNVLTSEPLISRLFRLQWEEAQNAWVLLYPEGMVRLNDSAAAILRRCDGKHTIAQMVEEFRHTFKADDIEKEVQRFVQHAYDRGWLA